MARYEVMTNPITIPAETVAFTGVGGVRLVADRWHASEPTGTAILLHGGGQTRHSWHRAGSRFAAAGWDTISLDARGHGDSEWAADGNYDYDAMVDDLRRVVEQSALAQPPVLVGASMGGSTALVTAGEHPGEARALVLVDIVPRIEPKGGDRVTAFMHGAPDGFASLDEVAAAIHAYNPPRTRPPSVEGLKKNVRQRENGRWYWHWDPAVMASFDQPDAPRRALVGYERTVAAARNLTIPTLLVRGQQSDIVSLEGVQELLEMVPDARFVDISGAGHMVAARSSHCPRFLETQGQAHPFGPLGRRRRIPIMVACGALI